MLGWNGETPVPSFVTHRGQRGFQHVETFVHLLVGCDQRDQDANHVGVRTGGDRDQAVLVAILRDLLGFVGGRSLGFLAT